MIDENVKEPCETECEEKPTDAAETQDSSADKKKKKQKSLEAELKSKEKQLAECEDQLKEINDRYMRMLAEYDNFRRRSQKEKEGIYNDAYCDAISDILPVLDNLERAVQYNSDSESVAKGVEMTLKSLIEILEKNGIKEIDTESFNPEYHNAVMHVEDESKGEGEIVNVLQKGYIKGDKVIRYAMVTVAN